MVGFPIHRFYLAFRRVLSHARFLVFSRQDTESIARVLDRDQARSELVHLTVEHHDVPACVRRANAGVFLYRPTFGTRGCAPTKLGELLAAGVPVVGNAIGDVAEVIDGTGTGVVLRDLSDDARAAAATKLAEITCDPKTKVRARTLAYGVRAYDAIYQDLRCRAAS